MVGTDLFSLVFFVYCICDEMSTNIYLKGSLWGKNLYLKQAKVITKLSSDPLRL